MNQHLVLKRPVSVGLVETSRYALCKYPSYMQCCFVSDCFVSD